MGDAIYHRTRLGDSLLHVLQKLCIAGELEGAEARRIIADFNEVSGWSFGMEAWATAACRTSYTHIYPHSSPFWMRKLTELKPEVTLSFNYKWSSYYTIGSIFLSLQMSTPCSIVNPFKYEIQDSGKWLFRLRQIPMGFRLTMWDFRLRLTFKTASEQKSYGI